MTEGFGESVAPTAAIRAILGSYPFSIGLLREILQNSDDALALKQVFILDWRHHGTKDLYHPYLANTQGPALLAFNDALIQENDWKALRSIHQSSKVTDTSKIGKYGIGFRSCYHVTDTPHILSGPHLAILDPKHEFAEVSGVRIGGVKLNLENDYQTYGDHLTAFDSLLPRSEWGKPFNGTIFRLPLRTSASEISDKIISRGEISKLLRDFAAEELNVSLLFLRNVASIEIYEISADGKKTEIAKAAVDRAPLVPEGELGYKTCKVTIQTSLAGSSEERKWRIVHVPISEAEAMKKLSQRLGGDPAATLSRHKLSPIIDLAIPLDFSHSTKIGRLFTYLPLPLRTEFPVHINALFSLTHSRQNLRNEEKSALSKTQMISVLPICSENCRSLILSCSALIEWNRLLFDTYIPLAWAVLLKALVLRDGIENIFDAWPRPQAKVHSGDYAYWKDMPLHVARSALDRAVWPVFAKNPPAYATSASLLIADGSPKDDTLAALVRAGLLVTRPPQYLTQVMRDGNLINDKMLSPEIAHSALEALTDKIKALDVPDVRAILSYLLSTSNCRNIAGLPLIPSVSRARMALTMSIPFGKFPFLLLRKSHVLLNEIEESLFASYDPDAVSLRQLEPDVREALVNHGPGVLNVAKLDTARISSYLSASPYTSQSQRVATDDQIHWLNKCWDWVQTWSSNLRFLDVFNLVPTTKGFQRPSENVFDPQGDHEITSLLERLTVPVIDPRLNARARGALKQLQPSSNIHALLRAIPMMISVKFTESEASYLCAYLIKNLPSTCARYGSMSADNLLRSRLRALPIFPIISASLDGGSSTCRTSIAGTVTVRGVDPGKIPILPRLQSVVYLDLCTTNQDMLRYLDPNHPFPLSIGEMQDLMLENFQDQSLGMQIAFVKYLSSNSSVISRGIMNRLANTSFVPASDGSRRMPKDLVDPRAPIAALFPGASSSLPDTSRDILRPLIADLHSLNLFITGLSVDIIRDRIRFIAGGDCQRPEHLARTLINHINDARFDCRGLFNPSHLSLEVEWIPTLEGLRSPLKCRDPSSHNRKKELFDEVMPMVAPDVHIGPYLRQVFPWDGRVPFEVVSQQLVKVLEVPEPSYEKVCEIVNELGHRSLTESELSNVREVLQGRKWIPTRDGKLKTAQFALLGEEDIPEIGFSSVAFDSYRHSQVCAFLQRMGCVKRPSKETILAHLQFLHKSSFAESMSRRATQDIIRLLSWLPQLTPEERTGLFIPDTSGALRPFDSVYYNDLGPRSCFVDMGSNTLTHQSISSELASDLGLRRLGLIGLLDQTDDLDMGEDLMTTIRNRLREYTDSQLLLEFLANAADAGATEFNALVDEQTAPTTALLSLRCAEFQRVPALVIHNNSTFSDDDFKGILRTGVGGKTSRKDTIGQFGLGALTMFHITEFAMIVSGDQVLFLNPCKAHLSVDRASLRLPLSRVRKFYGDHLSPLQGLFGFNLPSDINEEYSYGGTLFRLPLRSSTQFLDVDPIFRRTASLRDLMSSFKDLASDCLLFTSITSVRLFDRRHRGPLLLWSVAASRSDPAEIKDNINAHTVTITCPDSLKRSQEWRILSLTVKDQCLPSCIPSLQEKYRLRLPPVVRIAACQSPGPKHNLFATLPLPIGLDLPVHISGSFILASDRRSIRLDEYENPETNYNRWLLTIVLPALYLHLLEDRAQLSDNAVYWPGNSNVVPKEAHDTISNIVLHAVYEMAVTSENRIFRSRYHPHALSPRAAHIAAHLPRAVAKVLKIIQPTDLVELPSSVTRRLSDRMPRVSPTYVHDQIISNSASFAASTLKFEQLQELINYLANDSDAQNHLLELELLPLADGSFTKFQKPSESRFYVVPPESVEVFKPHRLVDCRLDVTRLLKRNALNVKKLADGDISTLLNDFLSPSPVTENVEPALREWIGKFWDVFPSLGISKTAIQSYPLIPTLTTGNYVSISHCATRSIILADFIGDEHQWLAQCFIQMGFTPVDTSHLSYQIRSALTIRSLAFEEVLSILLGRSGSISSLFNSLDTDDHQRFVSWVRQHLRGRGPGYFRKSNQYRLLPIWKTIDGAYVSASGAVMLPRSIDGEVIAHFALTPQAIVEYSPTLLSMNIQPASSIRNLLRIPPSLDQRLEGKYAQLIRILLSFDTAATSIPVPNSKWAIKESNTLYSSQDALFSAAFGTGSERFVLPSFRDLENRLTSFGLKRQAGLNMAMFRDCVTVFQDATDADLTSRAAVIFRIFSEDLPIRVGSSDESQWRALDNLRFIPRNMSPAPPLEGVSASRYTTSHARFLPPIVSPNKLVRKEFKAIAWSQRALFQSGPHQRVFMVYPSLGVPTAEEVVNHLVVLATQVAEDQVHNRQCHVTLLDHVKQTYEWLNDHAEDAEQYLRGCTEDGIPLFLNVDSPPERPEDWNWKRGDHILLDDYDTGFLQSPRDFIKPFHPLLVAAGAVDIDYGQVTDTSPKRPTDESRLTNLCTSFDQMRKDGICTDVNFICDPPDDKPVHAHRAYLAAYNAHFKKMFSGSFREAGDASAANPIRVRIEEFSRRCVEQVLDYIYTAKEPKLQREDSDIDLALEMLTLMRSWFMTDAQLVMQNVIIKMRMVDPFNLDHVRMIANYTGSTELEAYCNEYETNNARLVQQARENSVNMAHN